VTFTISLVSDTQVLPYSLSLITYKKCQPSLSGQLLCNKLCAWLFPDVVLFYLLYIGKDLIMKKLSDCPGFVIILPLNEIA
jgi:hypothetical protein